MHKLKRPLGATKQNMMTIFVTFKMGLAMNIRDRKFDEVAQTLYAITSMEKVVLPNLVHVIPRQCKRTSHLATTYSRELWDMVWSA